ncbi:MAG: serpin family protein [Dehalococcoidia bacterium]
MNTQRFIRSRIAASVLAGLVTASLLAGCGGSDTTSKHEPSPSEPPASTVTPEPTVPASGFELARSGVQRETSPNIPESDYEELVSGNNAYALDLYKELEDESDNLFFSPFSVSAALAMTYAGARGETERQMADTLRFTLPQPRLHPAFNKLERSLTAQSSGPVPEEGDVFTLNIANSLWGQIGYPFLEEFLDVLAMNYGAGMRLVDFADSPEESRTTINDWVSDKTEERIEDLIPQGAITDLTRLVLANAIYFNASWMYPFRSELTEEAQFTLKDGTTVDVPMMSMPDPVTLRYGTDDSYQAVQMPYVGGKAAMAIIVPEKGSFKEVEASLTSDRIRSIMENMEQRKVNLKLPKFSYEQRISMADTLKQMGMPDAFEPDVADLSGMDGTDLLYISDVFHKAFVSVDEKGTEAAAATAVIVGVESVPMTDVTLTVDRPFIFLIRDTESGSILFMGRVLNPAS